jgi:hypothetical protein
MYQKIQGEFVPESRNLPIDFDSKTYLELNPDVAEAGVDPIAHYLSNGKREGRRYSRDHNLEKALAEYVTSPPTAENAFSLFRNSWSTKFAEISDSGSADLSNDHRIAWLLERMPVAGKSVLELGPLEGGHTLMLERAGAEVTAIEANIGAFFRSLIVKNHFNLGATFILGDFSKMNFAVQNFDLVVASGVLYHSSDPVNLLRSLGPVSTNIFLWTHYFEPNMELWNEDLKELIESGKWDFTQPKTVEVGNLTVRTVRQSYGSALGWSGFCGGPEEASEWIYREDLISLLELLGFNNIEIGFDEVKHQNGPAFAIFATKFD